MEKKKGGPPGLGKNQYESAKGRREEGYILSKEHIHSMITNHEEKT